jgi:hypothetical protein
VASVNDNVYVNIIANTQGFTDKMKSALSPIREFTGMIRNIMGMGGAAMVINKIVQSVGDMEKAYAKLHPESQKAVGSLGDWNAAMANLKANQGEVVSKILSPIRAVFLDMIDPIGNAARAINNLNVELKAISEKYTSSATKEFKDMAAAQKALADATRQNKSAQAEYNELMKQRALLEKSAPSAQTRNLAGQRGGEVLASQVRSYDESIAKMNAKMLALRTTIEETGYQMAEIPKWIAEKNKKTDVAIEKEKALKEVVVEVNRTYQDRLETAQEYMDVMDQVYQQEGAASPSAGGKGSGRGRTSKRVGRAAEEVTKETEKATEAAVELTAEWQKYADLIVTISASLGEAFVTGDWTAAIKQMTSALLDFIAKEAIAAGLKMILAGNIPMGIALLAIGGITMGVSAGVRASGSSEGGGGEGVSLPHMATGGVVTRPTLAMIGEAGPEAVVPLGRGAGGTTIIVQGSIWQTEDLARAVAGAQARW